MVDNSRYQKLYETNGTTIVEDRSAVLERDKLQREIEGHKNNASRSSAYLEAIFKKAGVSSFDQAASTQHVISVITTLQVRFDQMIEELEKKGKELQALRQQIATTAKPSLDDEVVGGGGG